MLSRANLIILSFAMAAAIGGGWLQHESRVTRLPEVETAANVGDLLPNLVLRDLNGKPHALSDFRGKRVLIEFWATWCAPCLEQMPALNDAQRKFADQGAIVLGIAMDDPERVRAFVNAHPLNYPILIGRLDAPNTSLQLGDTDEILPFSVLIDEHGRVLARRRGPLEPAQLDRWLSPTTAP